MAKWVPETEEQKAFLDEHIRITTSNEFVKLFNDKFGTGITCGDVQYYKKRHNIHSDLSRDELWKRFGNERRMMSDEQIAYLREIAVGNYARDITRMFNEKYGTNYTSLQIQTAKKRYHIRSSADGDNIGNTRHRTATPKGYKYENYHGNITSFKKGNKPHNTKPIGSVTVDTNGYIKIKTRNDDVASRFNWDPLHLLVYEYYNGPLPEGYVINFIDGNTFNLAKENMVALSKNEHYQANVVIGRSKNPELNKTVVALAKLRAKTTEATERMKNGQKED